MSRLFEKQILTLYGNAGGLWLEKLPALIQELSFEWELSEIVPFENLSYNYVVTGRQKNKEVVLKLGFDYALLEREARALRVFSGHGVVQLLNQKPGVLLLERIKPGISLKSYFLDREEESITIFSQVKNWLHQNLIFEPENFPHLRDWLTLLDQEWTIPLEYLIEARKLRDKLLSSCKQEVLLHGDLHHDNILNSGKDKWVAIDPKGVFGDPYFELAAFIRNPWPNLVEHPHISKLIVNRIIQLSDDRSRALRWVFVESVLSWIWSLQDGLDTQYFAAYTQLCYRLLQEEL